MKVRESHVKSLRLLQLEKAIQTIAQMLPNQVQVQTSLLNEVQFISAPLPNIDPEIFTSLFEAIRSHRTVSFGYHSISATEYSPHKLKGDYYAVGY